MKLRRRGHLAVASDDMDPEAACRSSTASKRDACTTSTPLLVARAVFRWVMEGAQHLDETTIWYDLDVMPESPNSRRSLSTLCAELRTEIHLAYPYSAGLSFLAENCSIIDAESFAVQKQWSRFWSRPGATVDLCDYGSGFGDLLSNVLSTVDRSQASTSVDIIDADVRFRDYVAIRLRREGITTAEAFAPTDFVDLRRKYDAILLSHVLYYIPDRDKLLQALFARLKRRGSIAVVLRSTSCDSYKFRSELKKLGLNTPWTTPRPRITTQQVRKQLARLGAEGISVQPIRRKLRLAVKDVSFDDLSSGAPSSFATEYVRFVCHLPVHTPTVNPQAVAVVRRLLDERRNGRFYQLDICDDVLIAHKR